MKTVPVRPTAPPPAAYGPRAARAIARLSVAQLSRATGYSEGYLRTLERDYLRVAAGDKTAQLAPLYAAQKISRALQMDVEIFYRLDQNRPTAKKPSAVSGSNTACATDSSAANGMKNARNPPRGSALHHSPIRRVAATARRASPATGASAA